MSDVTALIDLTTAILWLLFILGLLALAGVALWKIRKGA